MPLSVIMMRPVFLRALEYYTGVLFLTTNRVGILDDAFKSRIHMSLFYPALSWTQTEAIWTKHLNRLEKRRDITVKREEILKFANAEFDKQVSRHGFGWNGRQIRNAFQTAVALAEHDACRLATDAEHPPKTDLRCDFFEKVAEAAVQFDEYLMSVYNHSFRDHMRRREWRDDGFLGPGQTSHATNGHQPSAQAPGSGWSVPLNKLKPEPQNFAPQWPTGNSVHQQGSRPGYGGPTSQMHMGYNQGHASQPNANMNQGYGQPYNQPQVNYAMGGQPQLQPSYPGSGIPPSQGFPGGHYPTQGPPIGTESEIGAGSQASVYPNPGIGQPSAPNGQQSNNQYVQPGAGNQQLPNSQYTQSRGTNPQPPNYPYGPAGGSGLGN